MAKQVKIGTNKGKPRVWIEGSTLSDAGFSRGDHFHLYIDGATGMGMLIERAEDGKRKVSGKGDHPIVDIATSELSVLGAMGEYLDVVEAANGRLMLCNLNGGK